MIINLILQMGKYVTERLSDLSNTMQHVSDKKRPELLTQNQTQFSNVQGRSLAAKPEMGTRVSEATV